MVITMKKRPLIGIIIPVYNVEQYLRRCLDSIVSQTWRNLQIILVDDGSTDNSGRICDEYAGKDRKSIKRTEVFPKHEIPELKRHPHTISLLSIQMIMSKSGMYSV